MFVIQNCQDYVEEKYLNCRGKIIEKILFCKIEQSFCFFVNKNMKNTQQYSKKSLTIISFFGIVYYGLNL